MDSFRFSPIKDKITLFNAIEYLHFAAHRLCKQKLGYLLPIAGNLGIFCHYDDEFEELIEIRKELTDMNVNWNQKYFKLNKPLVIQAKDEIPTTSYTFLYIRKPETTHLQVGDIDFYVKPDVYIELKQLVKAGKFPKGVGLLERPNLDLIELLDPDIDVASYVGSYDLNEILKNQNA